MSALRRRGCLNENPGKSDQYPLGLVPVGLVPGSMRRLALFAVLGPCLAGTTFLLLVLPMASWLEGGGVATSLSVGQVWTAALVCVFPALVVGLFDWIAEIIEVPHRPIGAAIVGWVLAVVALRGFLAMPDLQGWFAAIGLIGGIPAWICSWLTSKIAPKNYRAELN